jgi:hypothetical protein
MNGDGDKWRTREKGHIWRGDNWGVKGRSREMEKKRKKIRKAKEREG